ncbi:MAG: restriction endonuclease subunit S [Acidobacteriia bacterium]|nr:restriction endonuclease subunit S [Terriglobia bacterium]
MSTTAQQVRTEVETPETELPEGWVLALLPEVCELNPPKPAANALPPGADVSFVPMPAVDADLGAITKAEKRPFVKVRKGYTAFRDNDVLMAKITPCMENGKAAVARGLENGLGFGSTEFHVFRSNGAILPDYLYHFIRQDSFRRSAENEMTGSVGQKRVPVDFLEETSIPVPPLPEQERIIQKLNQLVNNTRLVRNRLHKLPKILKHLREAVLAAACSGKLTVEWRREHPDVEPASSLLKRIVLSRKGQKSRDARGRQESSDGDDEVNRWDIPEMWEWCRVDQIATVSLGGTPSRKVAAYWGGDIAWVSSGEVANCRIRKTNETISDLGLEKSNAKLYPRGTVLIAMIGEGKTRGQAAILEIEACTNQNAAGLIVEPGTVNSEYVWLWALSEYERTRAVGRGGNQPALNGEKVRNLEVPLPPVEEQQEIVRRVEALFKLADAIEKRVATVSFRAERLTQAILAKALRGELVPIEAELARREGREYEPASMLLEKIKTGSSKDEARRARTRIRWRVGSSSHG